MDGFMRALVSVWTDSGFSNLTWENCVMILVGLVLLYLSIAKEYEPLLLLPIAFGCIMANFPNTGFEDEMGVMMAIGFGIKYEIFPPLIFMGVGAMTDFGPLIANPKTMLLGAAAQIGVFVALAGAMMLGFNVQEAASIGIIGGADGPTSVYLTSKLAPHVSRLAAEALGELRVYQLRANTPEAFYESLVLSFSVDHKNPEKEKNGLSPFVKLMGKEMTGTAGSTAAKQAVSDKKNAAIPFAGKMWKEAEIGEPYKQFLEKRGIRLYVSGETRWKEKKSRGGKAYRLAKVKAGLYTGGCLIPFFAEGLILEDGDSTTYILFASDQKSGAYFVPYVEKAAREMK